MLGDERVLGRSEFVEQIRQQVEGQAAQAQSRLRALSVETVMARVCEAEGIRLEEIIGAGWRVVGGPTPLIGRVSSGRLQNTFFQ